MTLSIESNNRMLKKSIQRWPYLSSTITFEQNIYPPPHFLVFSLFAENPCCKFV